MGPHDDGYFVSTAPRTAGRQLPVAEAPPPLRRRGRRSRELATLAAVVALAVVAVQLASEPPARLTVPGPVGVVTDEGGGSYRFQAVDAAGAPVRWDPCTPIAYVVNLDHAPYGTSLDDVRGAFHRVGEVAGLRFRFVGETDEPATVHRSPYQPDRYGSGWAPVLVAWTDASHVPTLAGDVAATAQAVPAGDPPVYVSGAINLDADHALRPGFGRGRAWGTVLLHEAGHLVGLEHVDDHREVMHPGGERSQPSATVRWGVGDREGLRRLGLEGGCRPGPSVPVGR